jgi:hypothetical protein
VSDLEYDVLDELYFIQSFAQLVEATHLEEKELKQVLIKMQAKGWVRCYHSASDEIPQDDIDIDVNYTHYLYLASRNGLIKHNTSN